MAERDAFIEVRGLTKSYASKVAVLRFDLTVAAGEFVSLLGPSGSGKTTVLRMVAGLARPDAGRIRIGDVVVADRGLHLPPERRGVGMVFQDFALWPHMNVAGNVAFGLRLRRLPRRERARRVEELLALTNLEGLAHRFPHQLSGGQQQRVSLARALATSPRLLLLDEPLSSLDAGLREAMRVEILRIVRATGTTVLNVTHDQDEAMMMSDRVVVLRDGSVQQEGSPAELYWQPRTAFVGSFMGPANVFEGRLCDVDGGLGTVECGGIRLGGRLSEGGLDGAQVSLLCRVEDVGVHVHQPNGAVNQLRGTVKVSWFAGGRWHLRLDVGAGQELRAFAQADPGPGATLWATLPPDRCRVVRTEP